MCFSDGGKETFYWLVMCSIVKKFHGAIIIRDLRNWWKKLYNFYEGK